MKQPARYKVGDLVRYDNKKARVVDAWFDGERMRYEVRFVIGKNEVGDGYSTVEAFLSPWEGPRSERLQPKRKRDA